MSAEGVPMFPAPLTTQGRLVWAFEQQDRAEWFMKHTATSYASALADGASAASMQWELENFKRHREESAKAKTLVDEAREEYNRELDLRIEQKKEMPPAVGAAEGVEKPIV